MQPRQVFASYAGNGDWKAEYRYCPRCGESFESGALGAASRAASRRRRAVRSKSSLREPLQCAVCGFTLHGNPLPGVVILIQHEGKVLLCKRAQSSFQPGKWCLPGGFIERDEDFLTAGIRETREETGLDVEIRGIVSVVTNYLSPKLHTLVIVLVAGVKGGRARAGDDAVDVAWVDPSKGLPDMAFKADTHIITRWFDRPFTGAPVDPRYSAARGVKPGRARKRR